MAWTDLVACIPVSILCSFSEKPLQGNMNPTAYVLWTMKPGLVALTTAQTELYKITHNMKDSVETCNPMLV